MSPEVQVASAVRWPLPRARAARVARAVLRGEGIRSGTVSLAFVGARRMRSLNRQWFGKDRPTDVIAFGLGAPGHHGTGAPVLGDIYICPDVAARNARRYAVSPGQELVRLVIHGVLHVLGYDHPAGEARTASGMWRRQERYLRRLAGRGPRA